MVLLRADEKQIIREAPSLPISGYRDMSGVVQRPALLYELVGYSRPTKPANLIIAALAGR